MVDDGLTPKQRKALNKRIAENTQVIRERVGKRKFDRIAKAVREYFETKKATH